MGTCLVVQFLFYLPNFKVTVHVKMKISQKIPLSLGILNIYSVTQSFANSFLGYVVLDTFNSVSRDEDNM